MTILRLLGSRVFPGLRLTTSRLSSKFTAARFPLLNPISMLDRQFASSAMFFAPAATNKKTSTTGRKKTTSQAKSTTRKKTPTRKTATRKTSATRKSVSRRATKPATSGRPRKAGRRGRPPAIKVAKPKVSKLLSVIAKPKIPATPYIRFFSKFAKASIGPKTSSDMQKLQVEAGRLWRSMTEAEKQPFVDEFELAKEEHKTQMSKWIKDMDASPEKLKALRSANKLLRTKKGRQVIRINREQPKIISGYTLFMSSHRNSGAAGPGLFKEAAKEWQALGASGKKEWSDRFKAEYGSR